MISRSTDIKAALRSRQRGFIINPFSVDPPAGGGSSPPSWSTTDKGSNITLSVSNRRATANSTAGGIRGAVSKNSGKWFIEWTIISVGAAGGGHVGVATSGTIVVGSIANSTAAGGTYLAWRNDRLIVFNGGNGGFVGPTPVNGGVYGFYIDLTSGGTAVITYNGSGIYSRSVGAGTYFPWFHSNASTSAAIEMNATPTYPITGYTYWD